MTLGDYILIRIPIAFQWARAQKAVSWGMHYPFKWEFKTTATNIEIKAWAPKTLDIASNTRYLVNVTTLNGLNNVNGLLYPDQITGHYMASIEVYKANVLVEQGDAKIFVFKPNFPKFEAKSYLINSNRKAACRIAFIPPVAQSYSGQVGLRFRLPTSTWKYRQRVDLFEDDAGTGLLNGATINCYLIANPTTTRNLIST